MPGLGGLLGGGGGGGGGMLGGILGGGGGSGGMMGDGGQETTQYTTFRDWRSGGSVTMGGSKAWPWIAGGALALAAIYLITRNKKAA
jgi:hypothetical protein